MTGTNGFLPWATGVGANVLDDLTYAASDALPQGAQRGTLPSRLYNKALRQSTVISSMIGQFIVARANVDANDSQSISLLKSNFEDALAAYINSVVPHVPANVLTVVTAQTLWVRLDGNDANDGSANDSGHAFATILAAINASAKYMTTGSPVVIRLGQTNTSANPYAAPGRVSLSGRSIQILGDPAAQGSYVVSGAGASNGDSSIHVVNGFMAVSGVTLINTGTTSTTAQAGIHGALSLDRITFQTTGSNPQMHTGAFGGSLFLGTGLNFASSMGGWINASGGYVVIDVTATITFSNTPAWSVAGVNCLNTSLVTLSQLGAPTIVGSATGVRYIVDAVSKIAVNGAGGTLFPGSTAGSGSNYG